MVVATAVGGCETPRCGTEECIFSVLLGDSEAVLQSFLWLPVDPLQLHLSTRDSGEGQCGALVETGLGRSQKAGSLRPAGFILSVGLSVCSLQWQW